MKFSASRFARFRPLGVGLSVALIAGAAVDVRATDWGSLTGNSPFGQAPVNTTPAPTGELEFRGMVREDDVVLVNIFNTATQKSAWIPLQGNAAGITADSYDTETDKVHVTFSGKSHTLSLKQSRITLVQAAPPPPVPVPGEPPAQGNEQRDGGPRRGQPRNGQPPPGGGGPGGGPDAQQAFNNLPPEAKSMIEEIRRRRALRSQQVQTATPTANQPQSK